VREYYVNYGQGSFVGRFAASSEFSSGEPLPRETRVVVRTPRGDEAGVVLDAVRPQVVDKVDFPRGELLRELAEADAPHEARLAGLGESLLADAQRLCEAQTIPIQFLDVDVLFDGRTAVLMAVHWSECDITGLLEDLGQRHGIAVRLHDLTATPAKPESVGCETCGSEKSGCGSCGTGGGCSTGSCSKGSVKSSQELTAYFANLRGQMEATQRVPLN
jgi:hypothetical protein